MLDYLLDNLNRALGDPRSARWHRVIDAFHLKYPDVEICKSQLWTNNSQDDRIPGGFLIWRMGKEKSSDITFVGFLAEGTYIVQLFPALGVTAMSEYRRLNTRERRLYVRDAKTAGDRTVITGYGDFGYDGWIGELTPKHGSSFYQLVLEEDAQRYCDMGNRVPHL